MSEPQRGGGGIRKRHPRSLMTVCSVCGKKAFYQFYGTLACDSCRTFFRRCVLRKLDVPCINMDNGCDINPRTRKDCTSCRFQKCLFVGMRPDLVTNTTLISQATNFGLDPHYVQPTSHINYNQSDNYETSRKSSTVTSSTIVTSPETSSSSSSSSLFVSPTSGNHGSLINRPMMSDQRLLMNNPVYRIYHPNHNSLTKGFKQTMPLYGGAMARFSPCFSSADTNPFSDQNPYNIRQPYNIRNPYHTRTPVKSTLSSLYHDQSLNHAQTPIGCCNHTITKPDSPDRIPRPEIALIDTHIQGLTLTEKIKLYEMIGVIHSTLLRPDDLSHFVSDTRSDLNTMSCIFISRVIRSLNTLKAAEYLGKPDRQILLRSSVGKIIFLRSIPQFDHANKCWIIYKNPGDIVHDSKFGTKFHASSNFVHQITRTGERKRFPMELISLLNPAITSEFFSMVSAIDPSARNDFIFITITAAICFYDPTLPGLTNPERVAYEQNIFYTMLHKLIVSQSKRSSSRFAATDCAILTPSESSTRVESDQSIPTSVTVSESADKTEEVSQDGVLVIDCSESNVSSQVECSEGVITCSSKTSTISTSSASCVSELTPSTFVARNKALAQELEDKIFSRLRIIQQAFESSVLYMDSEKQIKLINDELNSTTAQTIYNVISPIAKVTTTEHATTHQSNDM